MEIITTIEKVIEKVDTYLHSNSKKPFELRFRHGAFLKIQKRSKNKVSYLEIHTGGYDDTLPYEDALQWIMTYLINRKLNGYFD